MLFAYALDNEAFFNKYSVFAQKHHYENASSTRSRSYSTAHWRAAQWSALFLSLWSACANLHLFTQLDYIGVFRCLHLNKFCWSQSQCTRTDFFSCFLFIDTEFICIVRIVHWVSDGFPHLCVIFMQKPKLHCFKLFP